MYHLVRMESNNMYIFESDGSLYESTWTIIVIVKCADRGCCGIIGERRTLIRKLVQILVESENLEKVIEYAALEVL